MPIDADVLVIAKRWGLDPQLLQAVITAEGGGDYIIAAVQCSIPSVTTRDKALDVLCRSCAHALSDFVKAQHAAPFVAFWAQRWAPLGATNDPHNKNAHWPMNVLTLWAPTHSKETL